MLRRARCLFTLPSAIYSDEVRRGVLRPDPRQLEALREVDRIYEDIGRLQAQGFPRRNTVPAPVPTQSKSNTAAAPAKASGGFFSSFMQSDPPPTAAAGREAVLTTAPVKAPPITHPLSCTKGLYLHGDVGCGKTHLMDLLYRELPSSLTKKRVHFHSFMQRVHKDMHRIKGVHGKTMDGNQLMLELAKQQCADAEVLCFDELVVTDVADAMILRRLFENMYHVGVCCFFTSNRHPSELYSGGLNRGSFLPFIDLVLERCVVYDMSSNTDHRRIGTLTETYLHPLTADTEAQFERQYAERIQGQFVAPKVLRVYGRDVVVNRAAGGVCRFTFHELCHAELSVADFSEIARSFHTLFLENVPQFKPGNSDVKRRFISLLDELYQRKVKVFVLAQVAPDDLEEAPHGVDLGSIASTGGNEETLYAGSLINSGEDAFQIRRAISRLQEMRTEEYAKQRHDGHF